MFYFLFIFFLNTFILLSSGYSQTWHVVDSPTHQNLARLDMVSHSLGWAVSYDGLILKYNGQNWEISNSLKNIEEKLDTHADSTLADITKWGEIYTIRMIDSTHGWIAVNHHKNRVYRLLEFDGIDWIPRQNLIPLKIRSLDFSDNTFGIAVGEGGGIQFKNNQWNFLQLPISLDFIAAKVISSNNMFIVGENGIILQKKDKWVVLDSQTSFEIRDLDFISPSEGWFVGYNGTVLHYLNGILFPQETETSEDLRAIDMVSHDFGFAVGKKGTILKYNGENWENYDSSIQADLHDIEMLDEKNGWIVGGEGTILKYGTASLVKKQQQPHRFLFMDQVFLGSSHLMDLINDVQGISTADFNGDGLPDLYLTCVRSLNHLLVNQGMGYYIDYTIESGTGGNIESRKGKYKEECGILAADFERDGDIDILLAGKSETTKYLINNGKAIFKDETKRSNLPKNLNISAGSLADFNEDGYPDVILADDFKGLRLFINQKFNRFTELAFESLELPLTGIRALATADFNGDHHTDILVFFHHYSPIIILGDGDNNWQKRNDAFPITKLSTFINSITVADFNNDGWHDLFLCTENSDDAVFIFDPENNIFIDKSTEWNIKKIGRSYSGAASDFDHDGDLDLFVSRFGPDLLYMNENHETFYEVSHKAVYSKAGYLSGYNTGTALADIDEDGDVDIAVGNLQYWSSLLRNTKNDSNYIILNIIGTKDTYEALGTKIWIYPPEEDFSMNSLIAFKEINLSNGFFSQN